MVNIINCKLIVKTMQNSVIRDVIANPDSNLFKLRVGPSPVTGYLCWLFPERNQALTLDLILHTETIIGGSFKVQAQLQCESESCLVCA